jgi:UDP-3-O-[3-hydroxymyristoyl] glucosamine N-acyltransferase
MDKKYKLTKKTTHINGKTLYQIKALISFGNVKKGDLGGWIEKEDNLSHEGSCWVYDNACVYDNARISNDARVLGEARVYGNALVSDGAWVYGNAEVFDHAWVRGNAWIYGNAMVCGSARVYDSTHIYGRACVSGNTRVSGNTIVSKQIKLVGGEFFRTNVKLGELESGEITIVDTHFDVIGNDCKTLAYKPKIEEIKEETGKKVKIRLAEGTIVEGEIVE